MVCGLVCLSGCGDKDSEPKLTGKLEVGLALPLTSDEFGLGPQAQTWEAAIEVARREINLAGGVLGKELVLDIRDTKGTCPETVSAINGFLADHAIRIILDGDGGPSANTAATVAANGGALMLFSAAGSVNTPTRDCTGPTTTDPGTGCIAPDPAGACAPADLLFQIPASAAVSGQGTGEFAYADGKRTASIIAGPPPFSVASAGFKSAFTKSTLTPPGTILKEVSLPTSTATYDNYTEDFQAAVQSNPDALFLTHAQKRGHGILSAWKATGYAYSGQWYLDGMLADTTLISNIGEHTNGMKGVLAGDYAKLQALVPKVEAVLGRRVTTLSRTGESYDMVYIFALAVTKAGSTDLAAVKAALREVTNPPGIKVGPGDYALALSLLAQGQDIDYDGVGGPEDFDAQGGVSNCPWFKWEVQNQNFVPVGGWVP